MSLGLRKGDTVQVVTGTEKGKRGKVLRVIRVDPGMRGRTARGKNLNKRARRGDRIVVQGINLRYKHIRRNQKYPQGGRIQIELPVSISNVMLVETGQKGPGPVRIRAAEDKNGKKVRVSARTGKPV